MGWFDWLRSPPSCPVDPVAREWLDGRWRWLEEEFGRERVREVEVILPDERYFPEPYNGSEEATERLLNRIRSYLRLDDEKVELHFYDGATVDPGSYTEDGYALPGSSGFYRHEGDVHQIWLEWRVYDPVAVIATLSHELGHLILLGQHRITSDVVDHEPLTDLLTVFLGMGVFSANAVVHENFQRVGHFSAWEIGRQGYLRMQDYGYAFALLARSRGEDGSLWARHLRPDVRVRFQQAMRFLAAEDESRSK